MTLINELIEKRANLWENVKDSFERAQRDGALDSPEAQAKYEAEHRALSELDARIREVADQEKRNADADEFRTKYSSKREESPLVVVDPIRRMANGELRTFEFSPEARDLSKLSAGAGLNTVPTSFYNRLQEHMIEVSKIRQAATVIRTASGEALQVPKTTAHSTAALIAEADPITENDPTFGQLTLNAYKYALAIQVSYELEQDTGVDLNGYLARQAGRALANACGAHFITGDGSDKPQGISTVSTLGVTGSASVAGVFTTDNLMDLYYAVIEPYRVNGTWLMADSALKNARKLKDTTGQYLWAPGLTAGEPSTLLGRPVINDTNMPDVAADAKSVLFGDLSTYMIRDAGAVRVERSVDYAFANDLITWRFAMRTDGDLVDRTGAVKHFVGGAA